MRQVIIGDLSLLQRKVVQVSGHYEQDVAREVEKWKRKLKRQSNQWFRFSKNIQNKINSMIPERVHQLITEAIKKVVQAALIGSEYTTNGQNKRQQHLSLQERDRLARETWNRYQKIAVAEGAGTGAGGLLLGVADFPLLISIKMKFLFETASVYGMDIRLKDERIFILLIFQLAFSSFDHRQQILHTIEHWETYRHQITDIDWRIMQQEYRDYIDLIKMLQLVPGFGAIVGAYANYNLLDQLGETAMNVYRMRLLSSHKYP